MALPKFALPLSAIAANLSRTASKRSLVYIARSESRAAALATLLEAMAPEATVVPFPAWDCLPFDRSPPSREIMGARMAALRRLRDASHGPYIAITTADAVLQRVPPVEALSAARRLARGDAIDPSELEAALIQAGYVSDDRIDEPGEVAFRSQVIEVFPAGQSQPCRVDIADGMIEALRIFDPATQRTISEVESVVLDPASEVVMASGEERLAGIEHWLPAYYPELRTFFDYAVDAATYFEKGVEKRAASALTMAAEAYRDRLRWKGPAGAADRPPPSPEALYLTVAEFDAAATRNAFLPDFDGIEPTPEFAARKAPGRALSAFLREQATLDRRVVLAAVTPSDLRRLCQLAGRALGRQVARVESWADASSQDAETPVALLLPVQDGFIDSREKITLITATDFLGSRAKTDAGHATARSILTPADALDMNDVVIHLGHGLGIMRGVETIESAETHNREVLRLEYAKGTTLLAPVEDIAQIWRYGSDPEAVTLDRLDGTAWPKRRLKAEAQIAETAQVLVQLAQARRATAAPVLVPPGAEYEAFCARFAFSITGDQAQAIDDVLTDLASGRPMDRLVTGDVGFGKTEVALRAAAATAFCGKQAAIVAPTTVLVRQHVETFTKRFDGFGFEVAHLSRLVSPKEAQRVRDGLRTGEIRVVIGTHALAAKTVEFADLGLVVIDEEQRFGTADKKKLTDLRDGAHTLTLTATPIPSTLQSALIGLRDLSVIATPPARRRPVRTFVIKPDIATVRQALLRESRRGGQSFVVVPRIEDMPSVADALKEAVPSLQVAMAHGKMPAAKVDEIMVRFANGQGDVLIATNIIETGLDVARANTIIVWNAEMFGLSQLHQLRGRVGRRRAQGVCYLLSDDAETTGSEALKRLGTLAAFDRLGDGLAIGARDLDARGAGDILGDEQTGHLKLIGAGLYQRMLADALKHAEGELAGDWDWEPDLELELPLFLPHDYVPEPELRVTLYSRFARVETAAALDDLLEEVEDRFGPPPAAVDAMTIAARIKLLCKQLGVATVSAGPIAVVCTLRESSAARAELERLHEAHPKAEWNGDRIVLAVAIADPLERAREVEAFLENLG